MREDEYTLEEDVQILNNLGFNPRQRRVDVVKKCCWLPPTHNQIKANTDGAKNDVTTATGISFRDKEGSFLATVYENLGDEDIYFTECSAIVTAAEVAVEKGWINLWVESDSSSAVAAFKASRLPWRLKTRWNLCKHKFSSLTISHIWREGNLIADAAAKKGLESPSFERKILDHKPEWIINWEMPFGLYSRLCT
ncbi:hypothetical protein ACHQM5_001344 [Ranunculus cassubicifolius]